MWHHIYLWPHTKRNKLIHTKLNIFSVNFPINSIFIVKFIKICKLPKILGKYNFQNCIKSLSTKKIIYWVCIESNKYGGNLNFDNLIIRYHMEIGRITENIFVSIQKLYRFFSMNFPHHNHKYECGNKNIKNERNQNIE